MNVIRSIEFLTADLIDRLAYRVIGRVDQHIEFAEAIYDLLDRPADGLLIAHVQRKAKRAVFRPDMRSLERLQGRCHAVGVSACDYDGGPLLSKPDRRRQSKEPRSAGDQHDLSRQIEHCIDLQHNRYRTKKRRQRMILSPFAVQVQTYPPPRDLPFFVAS